MVGLNAAGKSTILGNGTFGKVVARRSPSGCPVETQVDTVDFESFSNHLTVNVVDVGGHGQRYTWHDYDNATALIFVVNSIDHDRLEEARAQLDRVVADEVLKGKPLLVIANKQDLPHALSVSDLTERLGLGRLHGQRWRIQGTCAKTGEGVADGFEWLHQFASDPAPIAFAESALRQER